jgi:hypothetical protein
MEPQTTPRKKPLETLAEKLPNPKKLGTIYAIIFTVAVVFHYFPDIFGWLFLGYANDDLVFLAQILGFTVLLLLFVFMWIFQYREAWWPFVKAGMKRSTVLFAWTKNRQMKFVVAQSQTWNTTEIDEHTCLEPDPDATYDGPCRTRVALFIPEWAKTINIRTIMEGKDLNMDITAYKQYAEFYANKLLAKNRSIMAQFTPLVFPLIVIIIAGLALYPTFEKRMTQDTTISSLQNTVYQCNGKLVENGLAPVGVTTTTTTLPPKKEQKTAEPSTGVKQ